MKTFPAFFQFLRQNLLIIALLLLPLIVFCLTSCAATVAKHTPEVTEKRDVAAFTRLDAESAFEIDFTTAPACALTLEAPGDVIGKVKTEVVGGELRISLTESVDNLNKAMRVHLSGPSLEAVKLSGACDIRLLSSLSGGDFRLTLSGASSFKGTVHMKKVDVSLSGASSAEIDGSTGSFTANASGASTLRAGKLSSSVTVVKASGASNAALQADSSLDAEACGASSISYKGEPVVLQKESAGAASIRKER